MSMGISIIGIVDHKLVHDEEIKLEKFGEYTIITTSAWRNSNSASSGGISILINNDALKSLTRVITCNNRILIVNFDGNPKTTIITHYPPCEGSETDESHYADLTNATASIPKHNFLIVMGDFNAHLTSTPENKQTYHDKTNLNG